MNNMFLYLQKLYEISQQEPDVFKMPHELEDR